MADDNAEAILYVQQNVSELRKLGKEWGLTESQIDACVKNAMGIELNGKVPANKAKFTARKTWSKLRCCVRLWLALWAAIFLTAGVACGIMAFQAGSINPSKFLHPYSYSIMKVIRLAGVPLHKQISRFHDYYASDCFVSNPLYMPPEADCNACKTYKVVKELKPDVKILKNALLGFPLVHRGVQKPVNLSDIQSLVEENKATLRAHLLESDSSWANYVSDLARDNLMDLITAENRFSSEWSTEDKLYPAQLMRRLFPRPPKIPTDVELSLQKRIFIDGKNAKQRILPDSRMGGYSWYSQAEGRRVILFASPSGCEDICKEFKIVLKAGDVLTFPCYTWDVTMLENGDDLSISYIGHIVT